MLEHSARLLGRGARREQDADRVRRELRPGRPEDGARRGGADGARGRAQPAREQVLPDPTAARAGLPVDRRSRVGLDDVQTAPDDDGRRARCQLARREAGLCDCARPELAGAIRPHEPEKGLRVRSPDRIGECGTAGGVEGEARWADRAAFSGTHDEPEPMSACEREPGAVLRLDEGPGGSAGVHDEPGKHASGARCAPEGCGDPSGRIPPREEDVAPAQRCDIRHPVAPNREKALCRAGETISAWAAVGREPARSPRKSAIRANLT